VKRAFQPCPVLFAFAVAAGALGCASIEHRIGEPVGAAALEGVSPGVHYAVVLDALGPPTKMTALDGGMAFLYEQVRIRERQYGLVGAGPITKWIKAVYASADARIETVVLVFDEAGTLRGADRRRWTADAGGGMSVSMIFSVGSFTDTEHYESSARRPLDWGRALTDPLPVALNAAQSLETGANGLQLTTNSRKVGQHAPELGAD